MIINLKNLTHSPVRPMVSLNSVKSLFLPNACKIGNQGQSGQVLPLVQRLARDRLREESSRNKVRIPDMLVNLLHLTYLITY